MIKDSREQNYPTTYKGSSIKEFMRLNPFAFEEGPDLVTAKNWIQQIKEILEVLGCTNDQKVCFSAFRMTGDAKRWWLSVKLLEEQRLVKITLTYERFKELLFDRYFPSSVREEKIKEFTNLTQGNMTIREYATKFVELSCFALFLILNEVRKAKKFEKGPRCRIYELVVGFQVQNFSDLVDKVSVLETSIWSSTESAKQTKRLAPSSIQVETPCYFTCGNSGHIKKNCREPLLVVLAQNQDRGKQPIPLGRGGPARVYSLIKLELENAKGADVVG
ncbi:uncharacterized protein LOC131160042 [Malania oleifera]|uniref:uncharacterized protein LOC131160042 n=1 Tax=Malania oleifera TaxID=397392 RepID=UPI0025AE56C8|nr:uncharacterized protein LOC131160042 [Malania oleifera]